MIVRPRPSGLNLFFILRGSVLPTIMPKVLAVVVLAAAVSWWHHVSPGPFRDLNPAPFTLLGLALSIFLGFRNNACYARWWEGRQQWGQLLAETRTLVRVATTLLPEDAASRQRFCRRSVAFAHALRAQLRGTEADSPGEWLPPGEWEEIKRRRGRPDAILRAQSEELGRLRRDGVLSDILFGLLSDRLRAITDLQTACERLRSTPMPFTYSLLLHRTAWLFCAFLPFALVDMLGLATPLASAVLAYAFFGLDALGDELEEPFGLSQNAVPIDSLVRAVEIAALEGSGEHEVPPALEPRGFVLH